MKKFKLYFLHVLMFVILSSQLSCVTFDSGSSIPEDLINSFGALCTTNGSWTALSLGEAKKITNILTRVRDNPKCQDVAYAISGQVDALKEALLRINESSLQQEIIGTQKKQQTIMNMLEEIENGEELPVSKENLDRMFLENQLSLAILRGKLGYDEEQAKNAHMARVIVQSTAKIFDEMSYAEECLVESPQLLSGLISIGTLLGSSIADGGASLALASSHVVLGNLFEFYRKNELNQYISRLSQGEFAVAYQCVLESLSNQWCNAAEMHDLIKFRMNNRISKTDLFSRGLKIVNRDLPVLSSWLTKLTSPSIPVNSSHSYRQTVFLQRENMLKVWKATALGVLGDAEENLPKKLASEDERRSQFTILQLAVYNMNPDRMQSSNNINHPIFEIFNKKEFNWLMIGLKSQEIPRVGSAGNQRVLEFFSMTPETFKNHPTLGVFYPLDSGNMRSSIEKIHTTVSKMLDTQRADILNSDPRSLLWDAEDVNYSGVSGISGLSPLNAIKNILDYLKVYAVGGTPSDCSSNVENYRGYGNMERVYAETQSILCGIKKQIETKDDNYSARLQEISRIAQLDSGISFIRGRIERIARLALRDYLKNQGEDISVQKKLLLAEDIIKEMSQYGSSNLTQIEFDIQNALKNFEETTQNFAEIFSESLGQTFQYVYDKNIDDPISENLITKYCALLLTVPDWNIERLKHIDISLCYERGLLSRWDNRGEKFEFAYDQDLYHSDFSRTRMCHFKRFLRREEFLQSYHHDTTNFSNP
ncbi:MAG: hypothetical protein OXB84_08230 [Halobacteriovoraceae bacterium]|nr:hypothetical protein [Halobacteriovoraceae bacterium]